MEAQQQDELIPKEAQQLETLLLIPLFDQSLAFFTTATPKSIFEVTPFRCFDALSHF
jgi:hypothetical protein